VTRRSVGVASRFNSSRSQNSSFFDRLTEANKSSDASIVASVLSSCDDINTIIDGSYSSFADILCKKTVGNSNVDNLLPWQQVRHNLPHCDYVTLLESASKSGSFSLISELIGKTHHAPMVASHIGIVHLLNLYIPQVLRQMDEEGETHDLCVNMFRLLGDHLSHWFYHMDPVSRQTQLETLEYLARFYFSDSPNFVQDLYDSVISSLPKVQPDQKKSDHLDFSSSVQLLSPIISDDETSEQSMGSLFILTACRQLHSMGHVRESAEFLRTYVHSGSLAPHMVDFSLYGSLVCQAIPLYSDLLYQDSALPVTSVEGGSTSGYGNELLDELFNIHATSSSPSHMLLRSLFYKSLLNCERPSAVIYYESRRQKAKLELNRQGHNLVMKAHCGEFDAEGLVAHLRQWTRASRPLGAATGDRSVFATAVSPDRSIRYVQGGELCRPTYATAPAPPDRRTYASVINFFVCNKHLLTTSFLEELFENMQDDRIEPSDYHLLALFSLAQTLKAPAIANNMLDWYCHAKRYVFTR
jgi:hypothetical protein